MGEKTRKDIGKKLRTAREKLQLTQAEVADKAGISVTYYAMLERGEKNPTINVIEDIAKALKIKASDLLHS